MSRRAGLPAPVILVLGQADLSALAREGSAAGAAVRALAQSQEVTRLLLAPEPNGEASPQLATAASGAAVTHGLGAVPPAGATPAWVLLPAEAKARGFKNALAFRRWCRRHGVLVRRDEGGRMQWVNRRDIDRAIERLPARSGREVDEEAGRGVEAFLARTGPR